MSYQGYTNHATWAVSLWVDNDEGLYNERREIVRVNRVKYECAAALKSWIEDMVPDLGATLWSDLLNGALSDVNWDELAQTWIDEANEGKS